MPHVIFPALALLGGVALWLAEPATRLSSTQQPSAAQPAVETNPAPIAVDPPNLLPTESPSREADFDGRCQRLIVGEWEDEYFGKRHLSVRPDGTATMIVEPSGLGRKLFAERLEFEIEWSIADGRIVMKTLRGEPKSKVTLISRIYGDHADYQILNLDSGQMLLLDGDGKTQYDWRRPLASRKPEDDR
jgi:hypothetical protein